MKKGVRIQHLQRGYLVLQKIVNANLRIISLIMIFILLYTNVNVYAFDLTNTKNNRDNIAPTASFSVNAKKKLDVIVITDYKGEKLGKLQSSITDFKAKNLSKYDIRSVVANDLPKVNLGTQAGSYNRAVYGIVGTADYTKSTFIQPNGGGSYNDESKAQMKVCLNPTWIMPGETPPSGAAILPTSTTKTVKTYTKGPDTWKFDAYSFLNNSGMNYSYYPYYVSGGSDDDWPIEDTIGLNCGYLYKYYWDRSYYSDYHYTYSMGTTPSTLSFTFQPNISLFRYENYPCTNTVNALNLNSPDLKARDSSKAFYIIAMDGSSTDFYQSSIYNADNSLNYMLGGLRTDNLGAYVKDSDAVVLTDVDKGSLDLNLGSVTARQEGIWDGTYDSDGNQNYYFHTYYTNSYSMRFENNSSLQNMTLNQLMQSGSDCCTFDKNEIDGAGVIGRLDYFLTQGKDKIDLTVVTDNDTSSANNVSNIVKSSFGSSVDVQTTIVDNTSARKNIGQRTYYNFKDEIKLKDNLLRIGDDYNNTWYNLGALKDEAVTSGSVVATNIKDMGSFAPSQIPWGASSSNGDYLITTGGDFYSTNGEFSRYLKASPDYNKGGYLSKYLCKLDRSCINNEQVKSWGYIFYDDYCYDNRGPLAMYVLTVSNNLYLLQSNTVKLVCSDVFALADSYEYYVPYVGAAKQAFEVIIGVKKNGEAYETGYNVPLKKIHDAASSPIKEATNGHIITEDNTYYSTTLAFIGNTPSDTNTSYSSLNFNKTVKTDGSVSYYIEQTTEDDGTVTGGYTIYAGLSQGTPVKVESYPEVGNFGNDSCEFIKLSDNSVIKTNNKYGNISETNYTDFMDIPTNIRTYNGSGYSATVNTGTFLKVDNNGHVYINVFDNDYNYWGYKEIQIQDSIAQQMVNTRVVNVESLNNDLIKAAPLREGADRIIVYVSDRYRTQAGAGFGTYFPWGGIDSDIKKYLQDNNYAAYFVTPQQAMSASFSPPYISSYYGGTLNNLCYANIFDSYRFDNTNQLAAYLSNRYGASSSLEDPNGIYLIQGEDTLSYNIKYDDYETDPMNALKWRFTHDPNYFENGNGLNPYSGQWLTTFNNSPTQVGKYVIECQAQDRPIENTLFSNDYWKWGDKSDPQNVYVNRRPIADFNVYLSHNGTGFNTSISDNSYDLDRLSTTNKGITKWKWKYRVQRSTDWIYGQIPSYIEKGPIYEVYLEVLDRQGAWSKPKIVVLDTTAVNLTPTVDANPTEYGWTNQNVPVTITADDNGENDFNRTTNKSSTSTTDPGTVDGIMYQKVFPITYTAEGIWYLHMHVFDNAGNTSYRFRGPYKIDKTPPGGTATPYQHEWTNQDVSMTFSPWDALSGVQMWRYHVTDNGGASWGAWTGYALGPASSAITFNYEGIHKLQAEVTDNAGNVGYVTTGSYLIDKTAPVITPDKNGPLEAFDSITINLSLSDNLSGVKVTRYCFTESTDNPNGGWTEATGEKVAATQTEEGTWYLHVECEDNAGNVSYRVFGSFEVIKVRIYDLTVTMINDIIWRDYYFEGTEFNSAGRATQYKRREGTDIKAFLMPINYYEERRNIDYEQNGIDSGCEVSFYLRTIGNPNNLIVYINYITTEGEKITAIYPEPPENQLWKYRFIVPLECLTGTYVSFDVEAIKDGTRYGNDYWTEPWLPLNIGRKVFYISGNAVDRLKFNQSH